MRDNTDVTEIFNFILNCHGLCVVLPFLNY
jgi:hypothetical protein